MGTSGTGERAVQHWERLCSRKVESEGEEEFAGMVRTEELDGTVRTCVMQRLDLVVSIPCEGLALDGKDGLHLCLRHHPLHPLLLPPDCISTFYTVAHMHYSGLYGVSASPRPIPRVYAIRLCLQRQGVHISRGGSPPAVDRLVNSKQGEKAPLAYASSIGSGNVRGHGVGGV